MPAADTPGVIHPDPGGLPRAAAETARRSVTPLIAGTPHVRVSRDGGRTYPAKHARPLAAARGANSALSTTVTMADACCGPDYEPARRLTIWSRAGEDVGRSCMPSYTREPYNPGDAEGLTRGPGHHDNPIPLVQTRSSPPQQFRVTN